jgi:hypothetical protein
MALTPKQVKAVNDLLEKQEEILARIAEANRKDLEGYDHLLEGKEKELLFNQELLKDAREKLKELNSINEAQKNALLKKINDGKEENKTWDDILEAQRKLIEGYKKQQQESRDLNDSLSTSKTLSTQILQRTFGITEEAKKYGKALKNPGKVLRDMVKDLKENLKVINLAGTAAAKMGESFAKASEYAQESFGVFGQPFEQAKQFYEESRMIAREAGILGAQELASFQEQATEIANRTIMTRQEALEARRDMHKSSVLFRQSIAEDQAAMIELGDTMRRTQAVGGAEFIGMMETLTFAMGKSGIEAQKITANFGLMAESIGDDANEAMADFASQSNNLVKFGLPDMVGEFFKLRQVYLQTGVSMDGVISSMERFTTFEGALTAASKLNAVFGTTIDGLELMDTTINEGPLQGFIKLREQLEAGGLDIQNLSLPQFRALEQQLGLNADQLLRLGKVSTEELQRIAAEPESQFRSLIDVQEELSVSQKDVGTEAESLANAQDKMAGSIQDLANAWMQFNTMINNFVAANPKLVAVFSVAGPLVVGIGATVFALGGMVRLMGSIMKLAPGLATSLTPVISKLTMAQRFGGGLLRGGIGSFGLGAIARWFGAEEGGMMDFLAQVGGGAATGAMFGGGLPGAVAGGLFGAGSFALSSAFAAENNFVSKPTQSIIGEGPKAEIATQRTQTMLSPGSRVSKLGGGPTDLKLTVNLVTKEGKTVATQQINQTLSDDPNALGNAISAYLDENLSLNYS